MIEALRAFTKITTTIANPRKINLAATINECIQTIESDYQGHLFKVDFKYRLKQQNFILDDSFLKICLLNVLNNAFKFSSKSKKRKIKVDVQKSKLSEQNISISITDYGIGIKQNEIDRVFNIFSRGLNSKEFQGTGIGLSNAYKAIKKINGSIDINSTENGPTIVNIEIPNIQNEHKKAI